MLDTIKKVLKQGSFNLIIKGKPGTGKTMLSLTILKNIEAGIYISTRTSITELKKQIPWVSNLIEEGKLIEASFSRFLLSENEQALRASHLSEFLERLYDIIEKKKSSNEPMLLIVDSIEAIKEYYELPKESLMLEKALIEIGAKGKFNVIFVSETEGDNLLDYLSDGVITLKLDLEDGMILRSAIIHKLRGIEINCPLRYFTITNDGIVFLSALKKIEYRYTDLVLESTAKSLYPTGIKDLNDALNGGYDKGSIVLLLIDRNVPFFTVGYTNDMTAIQMMKLGIPWYYLSDYEFSSISMYDTLEKEIHNIDLASLFRPIHIKTISRNNDSNESNVLFVLGEKDNQVKSNSNLMELIKSDLEEQKFTTLYITVGLDLLEAYINETQIKKLLSDLSYFVRSKNGLATYFLFSNVNHEDSPLPWVRYQLNFKVKDGMPLMYISKPIRKGLFYLDIDSDRKGEKVKLIRLT